MAPPSRDPRRPGSEPGSTPVKVAAEIARAEEETQALLAAAESGGRGDGAVSTLGSPLRQSPFSTGFLAGLGLLLAYGLVHVLLELTQLLTFIVVAVFLALGLEPLVSRLVRRGLRRGWAVLVVMGSLVVLVALIGYLLLPTVVDQAEGLVHRWPEYVDEVERQRVVSDLESRFHIIEHLRDQAGSALSRLSATSLLGGVLGAGRVVVDGVVALVTVLVLTLYLMVALPSVKTAAYKLVPRGRRARVVFLGEEICRRVGGYLLGQTTVAAINGTLAYIMLLVLGLPFSAVLAVIVGILALVPIIGTVIAAVIVTLVALSVGPITAAIALGYYVVYHIFEAYVLSPRIMRRAVEVPPIIVILAVLAGGTLLGVIGALIAIPVAAGLSLIYEQVLVPRQQALTTP